MGAFAFLYNMFHRLLLLPMYSSSRNMCWTGSKSPPKQVVVELGAGSASLGVEIASLTRCGHCLQWAVARHEQQGRVQGCSVEKTFLIKMLEKDLLFVCFDHLFME